MFVERVLVHICYPACVIGTVISEKQKNRMWDQINCLEQCTGRVVTYIYKKWKMEKLTLGLADEERFISFDNEI